MMHHRKMYTGPIHSAVPGRTDHLPLEVPSGSYVIPADIVSHYGQGNTAAGFKVMKRLFGGMPYSGEEMPYGAKGGPYGAAMPHAQGGEVSSVPVVVAGGEHILSPGEVVQVGHGNMDLGHRVLDEFVKRSRAELVKTLKALPGPRRD